MSIPTSNGFLNALPPESRASLLPLLEPVALPTGTPIFDTSEHPRYAHFITSGTASLVTSMEDGSGVEVGLCAHEAFPETLHLLGPLTGSKRCFVQIQATALRISFQRIEQEFQANEGLRCLVLRHVQLDSLVLAQLAACNRLHLVEERLARWLLTVQDRVGEPTSNLTQDFLGMMLGTRRSSVTIIAGGLQRAGLIEYKRGEIHIESRQGLEDVACECYGVVKRLYDDLYR